MLLDGMRKVRPYTMTQPRTDGLKKEGGLMTLHPILSLVSTPSRNVLPSFPQSANP